MKTLFSASFVIAFIIVVVQLYLHIYFSLLLLRRLKLLKWPYGGMEYAASLPSAFILLGVLLISSGDITSIFQTARFYEDSNSSLSEPFFLFFARSFVIVLFFSVLYVILNFLNIRYLFRGQIQEPSLPVSIILCSIAIGLAVVFWVSCKEVIDNTTPKFINFQ